MKKGQELEVVIERFGDRGKSIARVDGFVLFVPGGVPGDRVRVGIRRKKRSYAETQLIEVVEPGPARVAPRCTHFGVCGGCKWQHVDYSTQCEAKRQSVVDAFRDIAGLGDVDVAATVAADPVYEYRNKMEFSFSAARWLTSDEIASGREIDRSFALGLHVPRNFEKVLDLSECHLVPSWVSRLLNEFRSLAKSHGWSPWNVRDHTGYLRHLVVRNSAEYDEAMVNLVVSARDGDREASVVDMLQRRFPEVTTGIVTLNTAVSQTSYGTATTLFGPGFIRDRIGRADYRVTPASFFQTNTRQADRLYDVARTLAELTPSDTVYDLYCGAGTIALYLASDVSRVIGVEVIQEAVDAARQNALDNGVANVVFEQGDMLEHFGDELVHRHGRPDVVVVDPPRAGMHPRVVERLSALEADRLVYVSCNPRTMARDIGGLSDRYRVDTVVPVDMFPHTHHTEAVARLTRKT